MLLIIETQLKEGFTAILRDRLSPQAGDRYFKWLCLSASQLAGDLKQRGLRQAPTGRQASFSFPPGLSFPFYLFSFACVRMCINACAGLSTQGSSPPVGFVPPSFPEVEALGGGRPHLWGPLANGSPGRATSETRPYYQFSLSGLQPVWLLLALHLERLGLFPYPGAF